MKNNLIFFIIAAKLIFLFMAISAIGGLIFMHRRYAENCREKVFGAKDGRHDDLAHFPDGCNWRLSFQFFL